ATLPDLRAGQFGWRGSVQKVCDPRCGPGVGLLQFLCEAVSPSNRHWRVSLREFAEGKQDDSVAAASAD
ncbi:MAG: hypothetical protein WB680_01540, partial [Candidatus Acidiferrales bacterium]